jgi:hypothetical protein
MPTERAELIAFLPRIATAVIAVITAYVAYKALSPAQETTFPWQTLTALGAGICSGLAMAGLLHYALKPIASTSPSTAAAPATSIDPDVRTRSMIAPLMLLVGSASIAVLALGLIIAFAVLASSQGPVQEKIDTLLMSLFTAVLPVFATWVGTIMAFYFTNESFSRAAASVREATAQKAPAESVISRMIPYDKIEKIDNIRRGLARDQRLDQVVKLMSNVVITRVIVFDDTKSPVFILRKKRMEKLLGPELKFNDQTKDYKIDNYLREDDNDKDATTFGFVKETDTMNDASIAMRNTGSVDVFVTKNGQKTESVLGWIPDDKLTLK